MNAYFIAAQPGQLEVAWQCWMDCPGGLHGCSLVVVGAAWARPKRQIADVKRARNVDSMFTAQENLLELLSRHIENSSKRDMLIVEYILSMKMNMRKRRTTDDIYCSAQI